MLNCILEINISIIRLYLLCLYFMIPICQSPKAMFRLNYLPGISNESSTFLQPAANESLVWLTWWAFYSRASVSSYRGHGMSFRTSLADRKVIKT